MYFPIIFLCLGDMQTASFMPRSRINESVFIPAWWPLKTRESVTRDAIWPVPLGCLARMIMRVFILQSDVLAHVHSLHFPLSLCIINSL